MELSEYDGYKYLIKYNRQHAIKVQSFKKFPGPWVYFDSPDFKKYVLKYDFPNHREIMDNEIVIDIDAESRSHAKKHSKLILDYLKDKIFAHEKKGYKLPFTHWYSGGDGEHIHIFLDMDICKRILKRFDKHLFRKYFIEWLLPRELLKPGQYCYTCKSIRSPKNIDGITCKKCNTKGIKNYKIESHICLHSKLLISVEESIHRKGKKKELLFEQPGTPKFYIPIEVVARLVNNKHKARVKTKVPEGFIPPCIKFFEGEQVNGNSLYEVKDGIYRIFFSLVNYYKQIDLPAKEITDKLLDMKKKMPRDWVYHSERKVSNSVIDYMVRKTNGSAGCNYRRIILDDIGCEEICRNCPYSHRFTKE